MTMAATNGQETRQLIERFVAAHEHADIPAIVALLAEDATWHLPPSAGVGPFIGAEQASRALAGGAVSKSYSGR
jgi:hypothetical protein